MRKQAVSFTIRFADHPACYMIEIQCLTKKFRAVTAVNNISFSVSTGEVVGFLGPNGAGKTTTMKIITGYIAPTSGTVIIDGLDIQDHPDATREKIGYLPERNPLYDEFHVSEYLAFVAELRGVPRAIRASRRDEMIQSCGLEKVLYKPIGELSKGFRQRVGIAQSLIHDPDLVIMDEPTSGLDPNQIVEIRELIKEIGKRKTVILSTHILPEVQATCNRMIIIHEGNIVAQGTTEELTKPESQGENVIITLKGRGENIIAVLSELPYVKKVELHETTDAGCSRLRVIGTHDIREELFYVTAQHHWPIMELYREHVSLEDIFRKLTKDQQSP